MQANATGWMGFGIAEAGGMKGADILYYESSKNQITDAYALDLIQPVPDDQQDWTMISASNIGGQMTVEAVRNIDTLDAQDTIIADDSWPALDGTRFITAWGNSPTIQYHGLSNRAFGQIRFYNPGPSDPLAAFKADPAVKTFEVLQHQFPIPTAPTTYDHQCFPLKSSWGGPIPLVNGSDLQSKKHIVAMEVVLDPNSTNPMGNVHHLVVTCVQSSGTGPNSTAQPYFLNDVWPAELVGSQGVFTGKMQARPTRLPHVLLLELAFSTFEHAAVVQ